jgi:hypothetical protein
MIVQLALESVDCRSVWSVIHKKEAIQLENVQRRATKLIKNIQPKTYTQRLKYLGLSTTLCEKLYFLTFVLQFSLYNFLL